MITFRDILQESRRIKGEVILADIDSIYPYEANTRFFKSTPENVKKAQEFYTNHESTQWMIEQIKSGKKLQPIEVSVLGESEPREKSINPETGKPFEDRYKYLIENGNHRYFAYKACGIKKIPVQLIHFEK